jgi:hypothetical protein
MMKDRQAGAQFSEHFLQTWIYQDSWSLEEAVLLALGISPDDPNAEDALAELRALLDRARRAGKRAGVPREWLWWAERNGIPFHEAWWLAITPEGPNGFDGQHFACRRAEILSENYLRQERRLIGKWARKPYWTPREAIDLSLNFDPFTTECWRGEAPETGETILEREDRFRILERALEIDDISEKAAPRDYIIWLEGCGYYVSEAWRRAVGITVREMQNSNESRLSELASENTELQRQLEEKVVRIAEIEQNLAAQKPQSSAHADEVSKLKKKIRELSSDPENPNQKGAQARRIASLEIALLAAAVDGHSYDPRSTKSDVPKQIADKAAELECQLTAQTVRKYLKGSSDSHVERTAWDNIFPVK